MLEAQPKLRGLFTSAVVLVCFFALDRFDGQLYQALRQSDGGMAQHLEVLIYLYLPWLLVPSALAMLIVGPKNVLSALGLNGSVLVGLVAGLLLTLPMLGTLAVTGEWVTPAEPGRVFLRSSLFPGFFEEVLYRAFLFGFLFRYAGWGFLPAALIGALIFGAAHLYQEDDLNRAIGVFAITGLGGVWFAWLFAEWKFNLWVPIALHTLMNLWWGLFSVSDSALGPMPANLARLAVIILSVVVTIIVANRRGGLIVKGRAWLFGGPASPKG